MKILVDADACPTISIIEKLGRKYQIPVFLFCDRNHQLSSNYSKIITVDAGADAADFALLTSCEKGDLVVTQDYGVAVMILGKGAYGIHQSGKWYTDDTIDLLLMERHLAKKQRHSGRRSRGKGPSKRTKEDDIRFEESLEKLIQKIERRGSGKEEK